MKIYTKKGDKGSTTVIGQKLSKNDNRIEAIGAVDEVSSFIGIINAKMKSEQLTSIQRHLYLIGADLAFVKNDKIHLTDEPTQHLEQWIDTMDEHLPELKHFILPSGTLVSAELYYARSLARKAERSVVSIETNPNVLTYLNRLSDYLFTLARYYNYTNGVNEELA